MTDSSSAGNAVRVVWGRSSQRAAQPPHTAVPGAISAPAREPSLFAPEPDGTAEKLATRNEDGAPIRAGVLVALGSYAVLSIVLLAIGWLLTRVAFPDHPAHWDVGVNRWLAHHRSSFADTMTHIGSDVAATTTVIGIAAIAVALMAFRRMWSAAAFLTAALVIEVTVFLTTTLLIDRDRPRVSKLDVAPPTSSFPSGHVAAAIALYVGLALIVTATVHSRAWRAVAWTVAIVAPAFVAVSRLYRGMHYPTDVAAGLVLGGCSLVAALLVVRTAVAVARQHDEVRT
jgi:membrane-associated phospholipid phosphatase